MPNYHVPQFIEIEDKIIGPLTFKQFIYIVGGAGVAFIAYYILPFFLAVFIIVPAIAFGLALAFYKYNNRPFIYVVESAFKYVIGNKLYLWKKADKKVTPKEVIPTQAPKLMIPTVSQSKLKDLAWSLDVHEKIPGERYP